MTYGKPKAPNLRVIEGNPDEAERRAQQRENEKRWEHQKAQRNREHWEFMFSDLPLRMVVSGHYYCFETCPNDGSHWCHTIIERAGKFANCARYAGRDLYCHQHRKEL